MIMVESPPQIITSTSSSIQPTPSDNDGIYQDTTNLNNNDNNGIISISPHPVAEYSRYTDIQEVEEGRIRERKRRERYQEGDQVSLLAVLVTVFRKSMVACKSSNHEYSSSSSSSSSGIMDISWPDNVRHVAHVTFDRFNGFLGLPVEFEPDVPRRPPSASIRVFGVSTESMQLSFDTRGNSVPTILLMMQKRLYSQGGLQAEGIFRINAENGQEEYVREQLNSGIIPDDIDVHCLAGLIKAWFRELPRGILDTLSSEQVMQAQTEEECVQLMRLLPPTEAALLDWAINLMADVAELEHHNKMNARNIAMVFAPNMTQMDDPLTALMYAVQVMNFLKTLITRILRDREDSIVEAGLSPNIEPNDENGHYGVTYPVEENIEMDSEEENCIAKKPNSGDEIPGFLCSIENIIRDGKGDIVDKQLIIGDKTMDGFEGGKVESRTRTTDIGQSSVSDLKRGSKKITQRNVVHMEKNIEKNTNVYGISRLNTQSERAEAWR